MRSDASNSYRSAHGNGAPDDLLAECCRLERPSPVRTRIEADASGATILVRAIISHGRFEYSTGSHHHPTEPWSGSYDLATSATPRRGLFGVGQAPNSRAFDPASMRCHRRFRRNQLYTNIIRTDSSIESGAQKGNIHDHTNHAG